MVEELIEVFIKAGGLFAAIGFLFAGLILPNALPSLTHLLPWALHPLASAVERQQDLPEHALALGDDDVFVALWRFDREEF